MKTRICATPAVKGLMVKYCYRKDNEDETNRAEENATATPIGNNLKTDLFYVSYITKM